MDNTNSAYNIIIPVVYRDYSFLKKTIKYIEKYLKYKKIFIITDVRFKRFLPKEILMNSLCFIIDENSLFDGLGYFSLRKLFAFYGRSEMWVGTCNSFSKWLLHFLIIVIRIIICPGIPTRFHCVQ